MLVNKKTPTRLAQAGARTTALALALGGAAAAPTWAQVQAQAQDRPWTLSAAQAFRHDSNIFRSERGTPAESDLSSITSLDGRLRARLGRQEAYLAAGVSAHRYRENDQLDFTGNTLETGLNWATVERLSGNVRYVQHRGLALYGAAGAPQITDRVLERAQLAEATVRLGITSRSAVRAGLSHRRVDYSVVEYENREYRQNVASLGYLYGVERALTLGVGGRYTRERTPRYDEPTPGTFVENRGSRRDLDLTAVWQASGLSTVSARLSATRQRYTQAEAADFSGTTGSLRWEYRPSGRLTLNTQLDRDTAAEARFADISGSSPEQSAQSQRLVNSASVDARYELTGKTRMNARLRHARGKLSDSSGATGHDNTTLYGLGVEYNPTRTILLGCEAGQESRSTRSTLSYSYRATVTQCLVRLTLD
jgi:hypothetical protein